MESGECSNTEYKQFSEFLEYENSKSQIVPGSVKTNDPQPVIPCRKKSNVWVYFQRLDAKLAKCRICNNNYKFGSSISNLRHHAKIKHPEVLQMGVLKFIEHHKTLQAYPFKHLENLRTVKNSKSVLKKQSASTIPPVKTDPIAKADDLDARKVNEDDYQKTETIYENEETLMDYMRSPNIATNGLPYSGSQTPYRDATYNGYSMESEEPEITFFDSDVKDCSPPNKVNLKSGGDEVMRRLQEERIRAEINYFNKKAAYMERNAEYVELQKRYILLQTKKLKMEIATVGNGIGPPY